MFMLRTCACVHVAYLCACVHVAYTCACVHVAYTCASVHVAYTCACVHVAYTCACVHVAVRVRGSSAFMNLQKVIYTYIHTWCPKSPSDRRYHYTFTSQMETSHAHNTYTHSIIYNTYTHSHTQHTHDTVIHTYTYTRLVINTYK